MANGLLIIAIIYFAARGYFLSLPGVIARLCGLVCGYIMAFSLRADLGKLLASQIQTGLPPLAWQAISSAVLFFGTLLLVSFVINSLFKLLARLIPVFRGIFHKEAMGSRISGAVVNSALGASLVLIGLWVYGFTVAKNTPPDGLQRFANRFGDSLFTLTRQLLEGEQHASTASVLSAQQAGTQSSPASATYLVAAPEPTAAIQTIKGTAEIRSVEHPEKRVYIERHQQVYPEPMATSTGGKPDADGASQGSTVASMLTQAAGMDSIEAVLNNPELRKLAEDPAIRDQAMELLQSNPDIVRQVLNSPNLQQLLNQLQTQSR